MSATQVQNGQNFMFPVRSVTSWIMCSDWCWYYCHQILVDGIYEKDVRCCFNLSDLRSFPPIHFLWEISGVICSSSCSTDWCIECSSLGNTGLGVGRPLLCTSYVLHNIYSIYSTNIIHMVIFGLYDINWPYLKCHRKTCCVTYHRPVFCVSLCTRITQDAFHILCFITSLSYDME